MSLNSPEPVQEPALDIPEEGELRSRSAMRASILASTILVIEYIIFFFWTGGFSGPISSGSYWPNYLLVGAVVIVAIGLLFGEERWAEKAIIIIFAPLFFFFTVLIVVGSLILNGFNG